MVRLVLEQIGILGYFSKERWPFLSPLIQMQNYSIRISSTRKAPQIFLIWLSWVRPVFHGLRTQSMQTASTFFQIQLYVSLTESHHWRNLHAVRLFASTLASLIKWKIRKPKYNNFYCSILTILLVCCNLLFFKTIKKWKQINPRTSMTLIQTRRSLHLARRKRREQHSQNR